MANYINTVRTNYFDLEDGLTITDFENLFNITFAAEDSATLITKKDKAGYKVGYVGDILGVIAPKDIKEQLPDFYKEYDPNDILLNDPKQCTIEELKVYLSVYNNMINVLNTLEDANNLDYDCDYDYFITLLQCVLAPYDVISITEVGSEKARYLVGHVTVISKNKILSKSLDTVREELEDLISKDDPTLNINPKNITQPTY